MLGVEWPCSLDIEGFIIASEDIWDAMLQETIEYVMGYDESRRVCLRGGRNRSACCKVDRNETMLEKDDESNNHDGQDS